jgi:hypothetical protein
MERPEIRTSLRLCPLSPLVYPGRRHALCHRSRGGGGQSGKRRWVDPHWFRGNSYFRIGWDWVKTALEAGWRLARRVRFTGNQDSATRHGLPKATSATNLSSGVHDTDVPTMCRISFVSQPAVLFT